MKMCEQEMKVTLSIHGREKTFSEQELIAILETYYFNVAEVPTEGKWFEVNPRAIDSSLFLRKREDKMQEETRELILKALDKVKVNPEKYGKKFRTFIPKKTWEIQTLAQNIRLARELGDDIADEIVQALEWAQRICNGESWEDVCNNKDTANYPRVIKFFSAHALIGGFGGDCNSTYSATHVSYWPIDYNESMYDVVPLVVRYEK